MIQTKERLSIEELVFTNPERGKMAFSDPMLQFSTEQWDKIREKYADGEKVFGSLTSYLRNVHFLNPSLFRELNVPQFYIDRAFAVAEKNATLLDDSAKRSPFVAHALDLKLFAPDKFKELDIKSDAFDTILNALLANGNVAHPKGMICDLKILFPEKSDELERNDELYAWFDNANQHAISENDNLNTFLSAGQLKFIFPTRYKMFTRVFGDMDKWDTTLEELQLKSSKDLDTSVMYASWLRLLIADEVKVTDRGIVLNMLSQTKPFTIEKAVPTRRRF